VLPDFAGILLWNLVSALMLYFVMFSLPNLTTRAKASMMLVIIIELMTSMQNTQSNALIAGLIILAFVMLERDRPFFAALCIVSTVFIKIFGVVAFALYIFYPRKGRLILHSLCWSVLLIFLPLLVVDFSQLKFLYSSWLDLLINDHSVSEGVSVIGWLTSWFNIDISKGFIVMVGAVLFLIPFIRVKQYSNYSFRLLTLSSVLIWMIIFNHKAESATFIIAMSGVVIWYFSQEKTTWNLILLVLAFVFTSLSPTDIFPRTVRINFIQRYALKAVPCIAIWLKTIWELVFRQHSTGLNEQSAVRDLKS
ncbi:MAG TPA: glycosyltransferase family 87 protein, partial [Bacteroidales bacterium]|nr:glycosyltransferase family 87 protein [Bacteroidales bacterium]